MRSTAKAALVTAGALIVAACQQQPARTVDAPGARAENPDLGLAIAEVPQPFREVSADADGWKFEAAGDGGAGILVVSAGPEESGSINLVEVVKERRAWFEGAEDRQYFGNRELGGPFGTIYTARGSHQTPEGPVEETWAYAIHPGAYRLLTVRYTYPTGESGTRVEQLMAFLGEIEALPTDAP